jgi:hypothetical protein
LVQEATNLIEDHEQKMANYWTSWVWTLKCSVTNLPMDDQNRKCVKMCKFFIFNFLDGKFVTEYSIHFLRSEFCNILPPKTYIHTFTKRILHPCSYSKFSFSFFNFVMYLKWWFEDLAKFGFKWVMKVNMHPYVISGYLLELDLKYGNFLL